MEFVATANAPGAIGPYSQATKHNGVIYVSGQVGLDPATGNMVGSTIELQAEQVFKNMKAILQAAGGDMNTVLKTTVLLTTMDNFAILNKIYAAAFGDHKPARATFACVSLPKNALIEIECIAHVKN